ncbi:DUF7662 domain-containing protein [Thalassorhabdomicrobium marinisediminis]|uniref:DUF7662 domain-containing protein n=1 Tax=Thalassorhabdomicrobium marinisediminis TaxID=2170577 RepID=UPI000D3E89AF|nr:hypothetical protein [Thalassorhabdomicrobium marinisediminis]
MLSYLEWVRLINTGGIRLDDRRITRWSPEKTVEQDAVAELMLGAPDLGTSANSFVLAILEPDVLDRIGANGMKLGKRLSIEMVRSFHSFTETACIVHGHDAKATDSRITLSSMSNGWLRWVDAVEKAEREAKGETLTQLFSLKPDDWSAEWVRSQESRIDREKIAKSRDTMFYGWACLLNSVNARPHVTIELPAGVSEEIRCLQKDFNVEQSFLAAAPLLCEFVGGLHDPQETPSDLLAFAALKQHERYVIKRDGAALDVDALTADVKFLKERDSGSATMLVQILGERLPSEIIQALKKSLTGRSGPEPFSGNSVDYGSFQGPDEDVQTRRTPPQAGNEELTVADGGAQAACGAAEVSEQATAQARRETETTDTPQIPVCSAASTATNDSGFLPTTAPITAGQRQDKNQEGQQSLFPPSVAADAPDAEPKDEDHASATHEQSGQRSPGHDGVVTGMYAPLYEHLLSIEPSTRSKKLEFVEIDNMLIGNKKLPEASRKPSSFWSNDAKGQQVKAWTNAGFSVSEVSLEEAWVRFERATVGL